MPKKKDPAAVKLGRKGEKEIAKRGPEYFRQLQARRKKHKGGPLPSPGNPAENLASGRLLSCGTVLGMKPTPDYATLVKLLLVLRRLPDATGETTLSPEEAAAIRSLGFTAESGRWKCPPLPPQLIRDNPLLEPLSAGWEERLVLQETPKSEPSREPGTVGILGDERRVTVQHAGVVTDVAIERNKVERRLSLSTEDLNLKRIEEVASKIEKTLKRAGKPVGKRRLQQLLWRYRARIFKAALRLLERQQRIFLEIR